MQILEKSQINQKKLLLQELLAEINVLRESQVGLSTEVLAIKAQIEPPSAQPGDAAQGLVRDNRAGINRTPTQPAAPTKERHR